MAGFEGLEASKTAKPIDPQVTMTLSQLKEMIAFAAAEFKRPSADEQEKLDKEKMLLDRKRKEGIEVAKFEEDQRKLAQTNCPHRKPDGSSTIHLGQIYSDGMIHPICVRCQMLLPAREVPRDMLIQGISS